MTATETTRGEAFHTGYEARVRGEPRTANPYGVGTWDSDEWFAGWSDTSTARDKTQGTHAVSVVALEKIIALCGEGWRVTSVQPAVHVLGPCWLTAEEARDYTKQRYAMVWHADGDVWFGPRDAA